MKKIYISKNLKEKVPFDLLKEIYRIICALPAPNTFHEFYLQSTESGLLLVHSIPNTNFRYSIEFSHSFGINDTINIVAYDGKGKIIISLSSELK